MSHVPILFIGTEGAERSSPKQGSLSTTLKALSLSKGPKTEAILQT